MQHIKLDIMDEREEITKESTINFAPLLKAFWAIEDGKNKLPLLMGIDPYGNTYFNVHQTQGVINELELFRNEEVAKPLLIEINDTVNFLKLVEQHSFAKFIGD